MRLLNTFFTTLALFVGFEAMAKPINLQINTYKNSPVQEIVEVVKATATVSTNFTSPVGLFREACFEGTSENGRKIPKEEKKEVEVLLSAPNLITIVDLVGEVEKMRNDLKNKTSKKCDFRGFSTRIKVKLKVDNKIVIGSFKIVEGQGDFHLLNNERVNGRFTKRKYTNLSSHELVLLDLL